MTDYDIVVIGGGLGGATLARSMAERGSRVLVLEREEGFRDRVRGEGLVPWGVAEARELGVLELLRCSCAHEIPWWDVAVNGEQVAHRPILETTPSGLPIVTFYHPAMQEVLLAGAAQAGAEVERGAQTLRVQPGRPSRAAYERNGGTREVTARLVVGADGRGSKVRGWGGFEERKDPESLRVAGVLFTNMHGAGDEAARLVVDVRTGHQAIVFPQGEGRVRAYVMTRTAEDVRLHGPKDIPLFVELSVGCGMPEGFFEGAHPTGPLASFEGAAAWVEEPYGDGVALVGDAAATSDPSWGQGLAQTLLSVRLLRDALSGTDDWDAAGKAYAQAQSRAFQRMLRVERIFERVYMERGPEADAKREQALPLVAENPAAMPGHLFGGPDLPLEGPIAEIYAAV